MNRFSRYELRTTDTASARSFYAAVLGRDHAAISALPPKALARGARPHWLGFIEQSDFEGGVAGFIARGAAPLGPAAVRDNGVKSIVLRAPGGAVFALSTPEPEERNAVGLEVNFHVLNTDDLEGALASYSQLLGWRIGARRDLGERGVFHDFSWGVEGATVGAVGDIAGRPGVHPHWLFFFAVLELDRALENARREGGMVVDVVSRNDGGRLAVCDDREGAAFGLSERPR